MDACINYKVPIYIPEIAIELEVSDGMERCMVLLLQKIADQLTVHPDRTWDQFKLMEQALAGSPGIRLAYFEGSIEVFMPGLAHEVFRKIIGYLIETFFLEQQIQVIPMGSVTQEKVGTISAQADESYCIGRMKPVPDLAIEVFFTSGGPSKLARYQLLGVLEVWFWQDGVFSLYRLRDDGYEMVNQSEIPELQRLNLELLTRCVLMGETDWLGAVNRFKQGIRNE